MDPKLYGIRYTPLDPGERVTGTVVVSVQHIFRVNCTDDPKRVSFSGFCNIRTKTILDHLHCTCSKSPVWRKLTRTVRLTAPIVDVEAF